MVSSVLTGVIEFVRRWPPCDRPYAEVAVDPFLFLFSFGRFNLSILFYFYLFLFSMLL